MITKTGIQIRTKAPPKNNRYLKLLQRQGSGCVCLESCFPAGGSFAAGHNIVPMEAGSLSSAPSGRSVSPSCPAGSAVPKKETHALTSAGARGGLEDAGRASGVERGAPSWRCGPCSAPRMDSRGVCVWGATKRDKIGVFTLLTRPELGEGGGRKTRRGLLSDPSRVFLPKRRLTPGRRPRTSGSPGGRLGRALGVDDVTNPWGPGLGSLLKAPCRLAVLRRPSRPCHGVDPRQMPVQRTEPFLHAAGLAPHEGDPERRLWGLGPAAGRSRQWPALRSLPRPGGRRAVARAPEGPGPPSTSPPPSPSAGQRGPRGPSEPASAGAAATAATWSGSRAPRCVRGGRVPAARQGAARSPRRRGRAGPGSALLALR